MRLTLGALLATAALTLAGCGSSSSTAHQADSPGPGPIAGARPLPLLSMTGAGGRVSTQATPLTTPGEVTAFVRQFPSRLTSQRIRHAIAGADTGGLPLWGAVVAVGCDRPPGVDVSLDASGNVQITAREVASPLPECLAAVTTVALVVIPGAQ